MLELIGALILAISPWVLKLIMSGVKLAREFQVSEDRKPVLRFILAVLSFFVVILHTVLTGAEVPQTQIDAIYQASMVFIEWLLVWLSTTGLYLMTKKKGQ